LAFSVYIHLPYCLHKCPYCDFNTYAVKQIPEQRYADALVRELESAAAASAWAGRPVATVFLGGGTPSLFSPSTIARLLETIGREFGFTDDAEISMEANPGSLEGSAHERLAGFRGAGVNRLSIGGQSFDAAHLATLGRVHDADDTRRALAAARDVGFSSISCDLMFAVPGQTLDQWRDDVDALIGLGPDHVSAYGLTYERGTPLTGLRDTGRVTQAPEDLERSMFELVIERLGSAGYRHYEISNFARRGHEARHNLTYWTWNDYLGIGAGAHGFFRAPRPGTGAPQVWGERYSNVRLPETYMSAADRTWQESYEQLDRDMAMAEFLILGLRLLDGIAEDEFARTFGATLDDVAPALPALTANGFLARDGGKVRLTAQGLMLADSVITRVADLA